MLNIRMSMWPSPHVSGLSWHLQMPHPHVMKVYLVLYPHLDGCSHVSQLPWMKYQKNASLIQNLTWCGVLLMWFSSCLVNVTSVLCQGFLCRKDTFKIAHLSFLTLYCNILQCRKKKEIRLYSLISKKTIISACTNVSLEFKFKFDGLICWFR